METEIKQFWNCFLSIQLDILFAHNHGHIKLRDKLFDKWFDKVVKIHPALRIVLLFGFGTEGRAKLIFLVKGNPRLNAIATKIIREAPQMELWKYHIGIKPYKHSITSLCAENRFLDHDTIIYQIYFAITKVYKTSNKLHLTIYLETNKKHSKFDLHQATDDILLWFLGDTYYYQHISKFKIVRRKFSAIRFMPLDELKNIIQYKHIN